MPLAVMVPRAFLLVFASPIGLGALGLVTTSHGERLFTSHLSICVTACRDVLVPVANLLLLIIVPLDLI